MSGPIVRKYGFPNFEQIFGQREIPHGAADESEPAKPPPESPDSTPERPDPGSPPAGDATEAEKESEDSAQL